MIKQFPIFAALVTIAVALGGCNAPRSTFAPATEPQVFVHSVKSIETTRGSNTDSVYLLLSTGKRYPVGSGATRKMKSGDIWKPGFFTSAVGAGQISLLESDTITKDDLIGAFKYGPNRRAGTYVERMTGDGSVYEVTFEIKR